MNLHPEDLLNFEEVAEVIRKVAKHYGLPLKSVEPVVKPSYDKSALGYCAVNGTISLTMRGKNSDGTWDTTPRDMADVWNTAAHELAHLRHFNHGTEFHLFEREMRDSVESFKVDHQQKVIDRLVKLQASRDSEAALGNTAAAEAFAAMINRMLLEHELNPSDIDYARSSDRDPVIEMRVDLAKYKIPQKRSRVAWQENLARIVANGHLCQFLLRPGSNEIWFVGTKSHAMVAEYCYGILVPAAAKMSIEGYHANRRDRKELREALHAQGKRDLESYGFVDGWLNGFVNRIGERLQEARKAVVASIAKDMPGAESQALVRLDGAMIKVRNYIDDKFKVKRKYANPLRGGHRGFSEGAVAGHAAGTAAADAMPIGTKAVTSSQVKGYLS